MMRMTFRRVLPPVTRRHPAMVSVIAVLLALVSACGSSAPAPPAIDAGKFQGLRTAAAAMPHRGAPDATLERLTALTRGFAAETARLKGASLNASEQELLARYRDALDAYQFSVDLMAERSRRQASQAGGDRVPVQIGTMKFDSLLAGAKQYGLPLQDETLPDGVALKVLPSDAPERVWTLADAALERANPPVSTPAAPR